MLVTVQGETTAVWRATLGSDGERAPVLSRAGIEALVSLCERAAAPGSPCRVIVLDSTPAGFCRGMDLDALAEDPAEQAEQGVALYADMLARLREARAAVIAVVRGEALAGGLGLLCAADTCVAPGSLADGERCSHNVDCSDGLICDWSRSSESTITAYCASARRKPALVCVCTRSEA